MHITLTSDNVCHVELTPGSGSPAPPCVPELRNVGNPFPAADVASPAFTCPPAPGAVEGWTDGAGAHAHGPAGRPSRGSQSRGPAKPGRAPVATREAVPGITQSWSSCGAERSETLGFIYIPYLSKVPFRRSATLLELPSIYARPVKTTCDNPAASFTFGDADVAGVAKNGALFAYSPTQATPFVFSPEQWGNWNCADAFERISRAARLNGVPPKPPFAEKPPEAPAMSSREAPRPVVRVAVVALRLHRAVKLMEDFPAASCDEAWLRVHGVLSEFRTEMLWLNENFHLAPPVEGIEIDVSEALAKLRMKSKRRGKSNKKPVSNERLRGVCHVELHT